MSDNKWLPSFGDLRQKLSAAIGWLFRKATAGSQGHVDPLQPAPGRLPGDKKVVVPKDHAEDVIVVMAALKEVSRAQFGFGLSDEQVKGPADYIVQRLEYARARRAMK